MSNITQQEYLAAHAFVDQEYMAKIQALNGSEDPQVYLRLMEEWRWAKELIEEGGFE